MTDIKLTDGEKMVWAACWGASSGDKLVDAFANLQWAVSKVSDSRYEELQKLSYEQMAALVLE